MGKRDYFLCLPVAGRNRESPAAGVCVCVWPRRRKFKGKETGGYLCMVIIVFLHGGQEFRARLQHDPA